MLTSSVSVRCEVVRDSAILAPGQRATINVAPCDDKGPLFNHDTKNFFTATKMVCDHQNRNCLPNLANLNEPWRKKKKKSTFGTLANHSALGGFIEILLKQLHVNGPKSADDVQGKNISTLKCLFNNLAWSCLFVCKHRGMGSIYHFPCTPALSPFRAQYRVLFLQTSHLV